MKHIKTTIAAAVALVGFTACDEDYDVTIPTPEAPYQSQMEAQLSQYGLLTEYAGKGGVKMGASVNPDDFASKKLVYSIIKSNFSQVEAPGAFQPVTIIDAEGQYNFSGFQSIAETAAEAGVSVFGPAFCSLANIPYDRLNSLIAPEVIPYEPWSEIIDAENFESVAVGTAYPSAKKAVGKVKVEIANDPDPAGTHGHVLKGTKLLLDIPKIDKVTLPAGVTLGDVSRISFKCYRENTGSPTGSRLVIDNVGKTLTTNDHKASGKWVQYDFLVNADNFKLSAAQRQLNSFSLSLGAYGNNITCYVDDIQIYIEHLTGDDTVIEKTPEEKPAIVQGEMDKWVDGLIAASGNAVSDFIIYDEPFDDADATFNWADYIGDNYVSAVQAKVNAAIETPVSYYVSQTLVVSDNTPADITDLKAAVAALEAKGVKVDGVNLVLSATFSEDYAKQTENEETAVKAMEALAQLGKPVRVSNFAVRVVDRDGMTVAPSALTISERKAVGEYYAAVISAYRSALGDNAAGFNLARVLDDASGVAPWAADGNRNFIYEGLVNGLIK